MKQRDLMRELFSRYGDSPVDLIREYARAERDGRVTRASKAAAVTPEEYARRLLADGMARGWISGPADNAGVGPPKPASSAKPDSAQFLKLLADITEHPSSRLLALYADILTELQRRGVVHSTNNPVGNYSEKLASEALNLRRMPESTKGYDAVDKAGWKYEVKGRRPTAHNPSRQLSMLRGLNEKHFDFLVGILYAEDFRVMKGCLVPHAVVLSRSKYTSHANAHIFHLRDEVWGIEGVRDITGDLCRAESAIDDNG